MSDKSIQEKIYEPIEDDLNLVIEEIINESEKVPENASNIETKLEHVFQLLENV